MTTKVIFLLSGTSCVLPADWNPADNTAEMLGAAGGGGSALAAGVIGGGGAAYSKLNNFGALAGATVYMQIGTPGAGGAVGAGGDTWLSTVNAAPASTAQGALAKGGTNGGTAAGTSAAGGQASAGIGDVKYSGGAGKGNAAGVTTQSAGGGGGAAGPLGNGGDGGFGFAGTNSHGGGGGANGGSAGAAGAGSSTGAVGGAPGNSGTGGAAGTGTTPATSGTNGGGGGGGGSGESAHGAPGAANNIWTSTHLIDGTTASVASAGPGGGGGGTSSAATSPAGGGNYGGGAGGRSGDAGGDGIIVLTYTPAVAGISAQLAATEGDDTLAATATVRVAGAQAATEGDDALAATAKVRVAGAGNATEGDDTLEAAAVSFDLSMGALWSDAWAEAQASVPANIVELYTIELLSPIFLDDLGNPTSVRGVRDTQAHVLTLEDNAPLNGGEAVTFTAIPFEVPWPEINEGQVPELVIRIDNIGREIVPYLDAGVSIQAPITVIFRVYIFDTVAGTKVAGISPISFPLRSVTVTESYIEGSASPADLANLRAMRLVYDLANYPGLDIAA